MGTNKHATIRYHALDRCFSNYGRKFFIEDLVNACNESIYQFSGIEDGVKKRQVFDDITFMESEQGWSVTLDRIKDGKRVYYRYANKSFSIKNQAINQSEAEQLKETLAILSRFKGLPHFEWIEEIQIKLEDTFKLKGNIQSTVGFEQNPFLKGLNHFTGIFNAIQNQIVLAITYQGYKQNIPKEVVLHPWYLKQYNNRWFLFGFNQEFQAITNVALDRIIGFEESKIKYCKNNEINFDEYFDDVIGVTIKKELLVEKVLIRINHDLWPYIESKPLHGSQKIKSKTDTNVLIELSVQVNHELLALLFSYMDALEIIEPKSLRLRFINISEKLFKKYI
ncbi:helix-turn-helix transcriptional regulator [Daejeonella sp.]|jgi:predicted DNA-binding transcriptional regulator YafY|uniref:helix-turn-helix transcriptional regulator n=1 Tax=Daejeonella sp. TaxID=2805397 RepID=UPI003783CA01